VAPDRLRFDFNHFERISPDQLRKIEEIVNEKIADRIPVNALNDPKDWLTIEQAKERYPNVKMFFGDKYGDRVRIVEIDPSFSVELCGGTHVTNTADLGLFKIVSETSIASGIRRIEAITGDGLNEYIVEQERRLGGMNEKLESLVEQKETLKKELGIVGTHPAASLESPQIGRDRLTIAAIHDFEEAIARRQTAIDDVSREIRDLEKEAMKSRVKDASTIIDAAIAKAVLVDKVKVVSLPVEIPTMEELKSLGDTLRERLGSGVGILGAELDGKAAFVCVVTDDMIAGRGLHAGKIVGALAKVVGGGGGGKSHMATAGGKDVEKLQDALQGAADIIKRFLK
jgi:alanyl-tRNA synthetase